MSKSLKNFTTIRSALAQPEWTHRTLRICFLMGLWQERIEVTEDLLKGTAFWEGKLNNFFLKSKELAQNPELAATVAETNGQAESADKQLLDALQKAKDDVYAALCDSFNTPVAMRAISDLVSEFNTTKGASAAAVLSVGKWITRMVTIFGLDPEGDLSDADRVGWSGLDIPAPAQPYIYPASQLRDQVRFQARAGTVDHTAIAKLTDNINASPADSSDTSKPYESVLQQFRGDVKKLADEKAPAKDLLALCDQLRDTHLWKLGIYLEDRDPPIPALVRPLDRSLVTAREERESIAAAKQAAKEKRQAEEAEKQRQLAEKSKLSHLEMFKTAEYSAWDADGLPTKDAQGEEVAKAKRKKLVKEWERQKKLHEAWLKQNAA
jgi:cysteinyl-tRNA synthetase